jgi:predicted lipoprotein with Yx(FWY)xxD motif
MQRGGTLISVCAGMALAASVFEAGAQARVVDGVLTDPSGLTLYVFDNDATTPGRSACTGPCLNMWTPLYAEPGAKAKGEYTLTAREDGKQQWTYKGKPLYRWYNDKKPGDQDGDGLRQAWHVARP